MQIITIFVQFSNLTVAFEQRPRHLRKIIRILFPDLSVGIDGSGRLGFDLADPCLDQAGACAVFIHIQGVVEVLPCSMKIVMLDCFTGQFAIELRSLRSEPIAGNRFQPTRNPNGILPVFFLLIDIQQCPQCLLGIGTVIHQLAEQPLRPVQQAGTHVVRAKLQQGKCTVFRTQLGSCDQVLVDAYGTVHLPTPPKQITERQVCFHCLTVDLKQLDKQVYRLVLLLIEYKIKTCQILGWDPVL